MPLQTNIPIQSIKALWLNPYNLTFDVLRLDTLHEIVSGNKWFKLKYYISHAKASNQTIATFGGAWSNHIVATAYAAKQARLKSIGIIRGEMPLKISSTLKMALELGMELIYVSRQQYNDKETLIANYAKENWFWIDEGGYGFLGVKGAAEILNEIDVSTYSHIVVAVGTGTTLAGLVQQALQHQEVIGISSMKGNDALQGQVNKLLPDNLHNKFSLIHNYHFGGYGKHPVDLIDYINGVYQNHLLPLDIVYTGKTFYAIEDLAKKSYFKKDSSILMIHTGGLLGNNSLPSKVLAF